MVGCWEHYGYLWKALSPKLQYKLHHIFPIASLAMMETTSPHFGCIPWFCVNVWTLIMVWEVTCSSHCGRKQRVIHVKAHLEGSQNLDFRLSPANPYCSLLILFSPIFGLSMVSVKRTRCKILAGARWSHTPCVLDKQEKSKAWFSSMVSPFIKYHLHDMEVWVHRTFDFPEPKNLFANLGRMLDDLFSSWLRETCYVKTLMLL